MDVIHTVAELRVRVAREPNNVFVPTMGNLHEGHIRLVANAQRTRALQYPQGACTVVSIFVNRMQFGPREDFEKYPRTLHADCMQLKAAGCDVVSSRLTSSTSSMAPSVPGTSAASPRWC
jgi:pantoate--beta-alanine ligase